MPPLPAIAEQSEVVVAGQAGRSIVQDLEQAALDFVSVDAQGESRTCFDLLEADGCATKLHTRGIEMNEVTRETLRQTLALSAQSAEWVAFCGSSPVGFSPSELGVLIDRVRAQGAKVAVDTSGAALKVACQRAPDLLRVNRQEFAQLVHHVGIVVVASPN